MRPLFHVLHASMLLLAGSVAAAEETSPRLVMLLTIDQARGDYLERFRPALRGGLAAILDRGVTFADAHHFHASTVTAAGHASLSMGLFPSRSGIVGNRWHDRSEGREVYCVEDEGAPILAPSTAPRASHSREGRSPHRALATAFGDWVRSQVPEAKVFSIGGKDRSSVLMGGKSPDAAFWYDGASGQWVTSRHYMEGYPPWVARFHQRRAADAYLGMPWNPLPVGDAELDAMEIVASGEGAGGLPIPRTLGRGRTAPDPRFYLELFESPFIESYLLDFARELLTEERLGADDAVDVLAIAFSSVDSIGHTYGPNSRELLDAVLRLDRELGDFLELVDDRIGLSRVAILLAADHGVAPLPEYQKSRGRPGARVSADFAACAQETLALLDKRFGQDDWFDAPLHFDYETLARRSVSRAAVERFVARHLGRCPDVERVWTSTEVERAVKPEGTLALYAHSFHPGRSPDLYVQLEEYVLSRRSGTTHGSPYAYDTHVTAALVWPGLEPRVVRERIHTVDLPVTLAALLGIDVPGARDGVDRSELLR